MSREVRDLQNRASPAKLQPQQAALSWLCCQWSLQLCLLASPLHPCSASNDLQTPAATIIVCIVTHYHGTTSAAVAVYAGFFSPACSFDNGL